MSGMKATCYCDLAYDDLSAIQAGARVPPNNGLHSDAPRAARA